MKRIITAMAAFTLSLGCYAQDMIVKKDGSIIQAKVFEIGTSEVKYKKWSNQDGPSYAIAKSDVLAINYQNGEKDTFEDAQSATVQQQSQQQGPQLIEKPAAANNQELINKYNSSTLTNAKGKPKDSPAKDGFLVFNFTQNSILSNEDIEISFERSTASNPHIEKSRFIGNIGWRYDLRIMNKTNNTIYVDLANTFRIPSIGNTFCYYTGENVTVSKGNNRGAAMNMGGVANALGVGGAVGALAGGLTVGGGNTITVNKSYEQQRFIMIPPHGHRALGEFHFEQVQSGNLVQDALYQLTSKGEEFCFRDFNSDSVGKLLNRWMCASFWDLHLKRGIVNINSERLFSEGDSPFKIDYVITYSKSSTFESYTQVPFTLYTNKVINCHGYKSKLDKGPNVIYGIVDFEK